MTLNEVVSQLHSLAIGGYFNGEKFTKFRLAQQIRSAFRTPLKAGNRYVMQIALPDGWWYCYVIEYAKGEFDYYIPDTRDQEQRVIALLK